MKKKEQNPEVPVNQEELPQQGPAEAQPEDVEASVDEWREALKTAVAQRDEYLDSLRRAQADFQNFRRRNQCSRADGYQDGVRELVCEIIPAVDNLERAIAAIDAEGPLLDGVRMTLAQLLDAMKKFGIEEIPAEGQTFDPEVHHAVLKEPTDDPGKVIEVLQKGYRLKDRVVRYAMVKVSVDE